MATTPTALLQPEVRAAIYARISRDDRGDMLGVRRQERDGRALAARRGWPVVGVYVDDDASAWSGRRRPEYERLLGDLEAGLVTAVVCYDLDRLHRLPKELEHFFDVCDRAGVTRLASVAGDVDLATNDGRLMARIMGAVAKKASDDTSRRIRRKMDELAESGRPHGRVGHIFGYEPGGMILADDEAELIRQAARDILAGDSLNTVARRWNAAGWRTPQKGAEWSGAVLKAVLVSPRRAALRVHRGEVVGPAAWPAILDRATYERLCAVLNDPSRRLTNPPRRTPFATLVRCGICGENMTRNRSRVQDWRCVKRPGERNCGRVNAAARPFEALVTEAVFQRFESPRFARALQKSVGGDDPADGAASTLADVEGRLQDLAAMFAAGDIGRAEWLTARKKLEERQKAARAALTRSRGAMAIDEHLVAPGALRAAWPTMEPDRQRAVLTAVIDRITIGPATRRGPVFDSGRVDITWRV